MEQNYCIYKHECKENGCVYIGQTCQEISRRWRNGEGYVKSPYFYAAIQKYGWDNFTHEILEDSLSAEKANEREQYWINFYKSNVKGYGYNLTEGGGTHLYSQESKNKMSLRASQRFAKEEERLKQSERLKLAYQKNASSWDAVRKPVECLETGEKFPSITQAAKWAGVKSISSFGNYFRGESKSCGKHPQTGERLHWKKISEEEIIKLRQEENYDC